MNFFKAQRHHYTWTGFQSASQDVARRLEPLTNLIENAARASPDDAEAQRRVKAAKGFHLDIEQLTKRDCDVDFVDGPDPSPEPDETGSTDCCPGGTIALPTEIWDLILEYVDDLEFRERQSNFVAIACSCRKLCQFTQPYLYKHPRDLDTIDRQWRFLFTLTVSPHLSQFVQSLKLCWWMGGHNLDLLIKILSKTSNLQALTLFRGPEEHQVSQLRPQDTEFLSWLLNACPKLRSLTYLTIKECETSEAAYPRYRPLGSNTYAIAAQDTRFQAANQLTHLSLKGVADWVDQLFLPHVSSNLQSLRLDHLLNFNFDSRFIQALPHQCPSLQVLSIESQNAELTDVLKALPAWGATLKSLHLGTYGPTSIHPLDFFKDTLSKLTALEDLTFDWRFLCSIETLEAIVQCQSWHRLRSIQILRFELIARMDPRYHSEEANEIEQKRLDDALSTLISSTASTLEELKVTRNTFNRNRKQPQRLGNRVFVACKEAKKLKRLWIWPCLDVEPSYIDALLETCPKLDMIPIYLFHLSDAKKAWERRVTQAGQRKKLAKDKLSQPYWITHRRVEHP